MDEIKINSEKYNDLQVMINSAGRTLNQASNMPGISKDLVLRISDQKRRQGELNNTMHALWNEVNENKRTGEKDGAFDKIGKDVEELYEMANELYASAIDEDRFIAETKKVIKTDISEFVAARNHHRNMANITLFMLILIMILGIIFIAWFFKSTAQDLIIGKMAERNSAGWLEGIVLLGGRLSLIVGIGWMFKHLSNLQRSHSQQSVSYQDRLAGLDTAELILTRANPQARTEIVKMMTETYLSLNQNAFRVDEKTKDKKSDELEGKQFDNLLKLVSDISKAIKGNGDMGT